LAALFALLPLRSALSAGEPPLDSSQPLPADLQPQVNEVIAILDKQLLPSNPQEEKLKACWFETLRAPDGDDRIIPWTRICPHEGVSGAICRATSPGEAKLGELIHGADDVPKANAAVDPKFIVHLKSDLMVKRTHQLPVKNRQEIDGVYLAHLAALREDALMAMRNLASAQGSAYAAIRDWIEARKKEPKTFYRCLALES
jgi:hypothetical protein